MPKLVEQRGEERSQVQWQERLQIFKDKDKKTCFMVKDSNDSDDEEEDEIVYIALKD